MLSIFALLSANDVLQTVLDFLQTEVFNVSGFSILWWYPCYVLSPLVLEGEKLQQIKDGLMSHTDDFADSECRSCPYT